MPKTAAVREREAEILGYLTEAKTLAAKAEGEDRDFNAEERELVKGFLLKAEEAKDKLKGAKGTSDLLAQIGALGEGLSTDEPTVDLSKGRGTLGQRFLSDEHVDAWRKERGSAFLSDKGRVGDSPAAHVGNLRSLVGPGFAERQKALVTGVSDTSGGALVEEDFLGLVDVGADLFRPLVLRDVVTIGQTESDVVSYARQTGIVNNAAPVPEATSAEAGTWADSVTEVAGGLKPESEFTLERVTTNVVTIAHWLPATKRALSDAGQVRTLIDTFLRYGLGEELEDQIVAGDGTGENFEGLLTVSGTQAQAFDTDLIVTGRKAITKVRVGGRAQVTAFGMSPATEESLDLMRDLNGQFYFGGPGSMGIQTLWGRPRVVSEAFPDDVLIAGDWRFAVLWDREQASVQVFDQHADFAIRNLVAFLAELRAAFGIIRPSAFCIAETEAAVSS